MNEKKTEAPIGILNANYFHDNFSLKRFYPKKHLQHYIEHYWFLTWELPQGQTHCQHVIPHPNTHLTFINKKSHLQGICHQKYHHNLTGSGCIVGVKFTPAGFYPFAKSASIDLVKLTDNALNIEDVFEVNTDHLEQKILSMSEPLEQIEYIDNHLFNKKIIPDDNIVLLNSIVSRIASDQEILKVSDICEKFSIEQRKIQRLFAKYIGISAKWVINRYRIHDALTSVELNQTLNWASLAIKLGYYDQAHFIRDFKNLIGTTPQSYQLSLNK